MATNEDLSDEIEQLVRRGEQDSRTHTFARLADLYRKTGDTERALEVIERGLKHHPHYLNARIVHARVLSELGRTSDARGAFERVLQIDSENLVAQAALAELGVDLPSDGRAPASRDESGASQRGGAWLAGLEADWQKTQGGNGDGDAAQVEPITEGSPKQGPEVSHESGTVEADLETATLAALYVRQGLFDRAISIYERLLARDPYNARLASALEDARRRTDSSDTTRESAETAPLSSSPPTTERRVRSSRPPGGKGRPDAAKRAETVPTPDRSSDSMRTLLGRMLDGEETGQAPESPGRWPDWLVRLGRSSG